MEYNTSRGLLQMKEYGRHVQKMVDFLLALEDPEERQRNAESVVELMGFLNPGLKQFEDYQHKLWDHLFVMSDFRLDVESPYPKPTKETYKMKTPPPSYPRRHPKYNHLGKNLELVITKAMKEPDEEKKSGFAHVIAHYMKLAYSTWHKELVHDDAIRQELNNLTNGELEFSQTPFVRHRASTFRDEDAYPPAKRNNFRNNRNNRGGGGGGNQQQRDNRGGGGNQNRSGGGNNQNRSGGGGQNRNNGGSKFGKKRY